MPWQNFQMHENATVSPPARSIQVVLFDWDDTICGAMPHRYDSVAGVLHGLGIERTRQDIHLAWTLADDPIRDRIANGFWHRFQRALDLEAELGLIDTLSDEFDRRAKTLRMEVFNDAQRLLDQLISDGLRLGIVSNNILAEERVDALGLAGYFETIVTPLDNDGIGKPHPEIFQLALDRLGVTAEGAVYIGDTYETDVVGARAAGIRSILVDRMELCGAEDCTVLPALDAAYAWLSAEQGDDTPAS